jgi:hypothetical protein
VFSCEHCAIYRESFKLELAIHDRLPENDEMLGIELSFRVENYLLFWRIEQVGSSRMRISLALTRLSVRLPQLLNRGSNRPS